MPCSGLPVRKLHESGKAVLFPGMNKTSKTTFHFTITGAITVDQKDLEQFLPWLPVLRLIEQEFSDWQIILMTHDRAWFDLAREFTEHSKRWLYLRLLEMPTVPGQPSRPRIEAHQNLTDVAERHLAVSDLMAAAVYVRAAFETRVRNVCRDHGVEIAYKPDPNYVTVNKLWEGIVARQAKRQADGKPDFVDPQLMRDVETMRSTILNQLSHSGSPSLGARDVRFALDTTKKLEQHKFPRIQ